MSVDKSESAGSITLLPRDELCLSAYVDGECGWFKRILARRTLQKSFEARKFVDELERTSNEIQSNYTTELEALSKEVSLWPRISARIAQEERLTLLRSIPLETENPFLWMARLSWGGLGAVAASALFFLFLPMTPVQDSPRYAANSLVPSVAESANGGSVNLVGAGMSDKFKENTGFVNRSAGAQVAAVSDRSYDQPSQLSADDYRALELAAIHRNLFSRETHSQDPYAWKFTQQDPQFLDTESAVKTDGSSLRNEHKGIAPQAFEVDWVRSQGRVRVLQSSSGNAAVFWVNKPARSLAAPVLQARDRSPILVQAGNR